MSSLISFFKSQGKNKTIRQIRRNCFHEFGKDKTSQIENRVKYATLYSDMGTIVSQIIHNPSRKNRKKLLAIYSDCLIAQIIIPTKVLDYIEAHINSCRCCHKPKLIEDTQETYDGYVCSSCKHSKYILSTLQNCFVRKTHCGQTRDGSYAMPAWFENNGYISIYDNGQDVWVKANTPDMWPLGILDYHGSKRYIGKVADKKTDMELRPIYCGYELEVECTNIDERDSLATKMVKLLRDDTDDYCYICAEFDGSLGSQGFELVSSYTGLDAHWNKIQRLSGKTSGLKSEQSRACGLHVHVSRQYMSLYHCAKVAALMSLPDNQEFLEKFARRSANDYCRRKNKEELAAAYAEITASRDARNINRNRYEVVNFQNKNTVEFRLYKGSLNPTIVMASIEFSKAVVMYCRNAGLGQLHWTNLVNWIYQRENKRETVRLRTYLHKLGYQPDWFKVSSKRVSIMAQ